MTIDFLIGAIRASRDLHPQVKTELEEILNSVEKAWKAWKNILDEEPVIKCMDCANWHTNFLPSCGRHGCDVMGDFTGPDDFCSKAVKRT